LAEAGGYDGEGLWHPAEIGFRPTYESNTLRTFIDGGFVATNA
jgi:nitrate reductase alpha subunit